ATGAAPAIRLQSRNWKRDVQKDGHFINVPSEWAAMQRESTIREVPAEEEGRSSIQFDSTAPVTHIYPPRRPSPEEKEYESQEMVEYPTGRGSHHMPLSPVETPSFLSAPPTPRHIIFKRPHLEKQFSFGRGKGRKNLTEEETIGLVEAGRNEAGGSNDERDSGSQHSEDSDTGESIHYEHASEGREAKPYGGV